MSANPLDEEINPNAPPEAIESREGSTDGDDPLSAAIRGDHLHREAAVRALGLSCYLWGFFNAVAGIASSLYVMKIFRPSEMDRGLGAGFSQPKIFAIGISVAFYFAFAWLFAAVGRGLRRLSPLARRACIVLLTLLLLQSLIGLVAAWRQYAPLGSVGIALCMIAYGSALGLLLSPSTAEVFAPDYREAVSRSPFLMPRLGFGGMVATAVSLSLFVGGIALIIIAVIR